MIKAVIFDMDGVIVETEIIHEKAWKEFFGSNGISLTEKDLYSMKGCRGIDVINTFIPGLTSEEAENLRLKRFEIYKRYLKDGVKPVRGVKEFMQKLKDEKIAIAVATSATNQVIFLLDDAEVRDLIDVLITGDQVEKGKPDPEIYLKTAQKLKIRPEECVVFEDALNGVEAGKNAGMHVVAILTSHKKEDFKDIEYAFNNFEEIDIDEILGL